MKVKLIEVVHYRWDEEIIEDVRPTDWEECSEEDYSNLLRWVSIKNLEKNKNIKYWLIRETPITKSLSEYVEISKNVAEDFRRQKLKKEEADRKRAATRQRKKEEKERKLLEQLKNKYVT